jgi:predicted NAD/FAD-dependent oxidoreductase
VVLTVRTASLHTGRNKNIDPNNDIKKGEIFVKKFELVTDALREIKKLSKEMDLHDKIFLVYNDYSERYFVTDDSDEISELVHQRWCDSGCDNTPENEAKDYKVWEYSSAENKEKYPLTYRMAQKSLIISAIPLIRRTKDIECEYSVGFHIS